MVGDFGGEENVRACSRMGVELGTEEGFVIFVDVGGALENWGVRQSRD